METTRFQILIFNYFFILVVPPLVVTSFKVTTHFFHEAGQLKHQQATWESNPKLAVYKTSVIRTNHG